MPTIFNKESNKVEGDFLDHVKNHGINLSDGDAKDIAKEVDAFFQDQKVDQLYKEDRVQDFKKQMFLLGAKNHKYLEGRLEIATEIFGERRDCLRKLNNVERQKYEIRRYELNPGEINVGDFVSQIERRLPIEGENLPWSRRYDGYGDSVGNNSTSWRGGSEREILAVQNRDDPIIHTRMPPKNYRNIVFDTEARTLDEIKINNERLRIFLERGRGAPLTNEEKKELGTRSQAKHVANNVVEAVGDFVHKTINWAGKGIIHKSKASEDDRHTKYLKRRSELLSQMVWTMGKNSHDSSAHARILKAINDTLQNSDDIMDQAVFSKMQAVISEEIKKEDAATQEELKDFNDKMQALNKGMLKGLDKHVATEDDMWKYRVLQVFLLVTPLGAFSIAGHVFNYLDPLTQLIGPLFDANTSLSKGIASMTSSDVLGPFGKIASGMRIDDGIQIVLDKTPIVSDVLDVVDFVLDSDTFQSGLSTIGPMQSAPLVLVGIAAVNSLFRLDTELAHSKEVDKFVEDQDKAVTNEITKFQKERDFGRDRDIGTKEEDRATTADQAKNPKNLGLKNRIEIFSQERFKALKAANLDVEVARFISQTSSENYKDDLEKMFGDVTFKTEKDKDGKLKISELRSVEKLIKATDVIRVLEASDQPSKDMLRNRVIIFKALEAKKDDQKWVELMADVIAEDKIPLPKFNNLSLVNEAGGKVEISTLVHKDAKDLLKILLQPGNEEVCKIIKHHLVFEEYSKVLEGRNPSQVESLITEGKKIIDHKFISNAAESLMLKSSKKEMGDQSNDLEKQIIKIDSDHLFELAKKRIPNNAPSQPVSSPLYGLEPVFKGAAA